MKMNICRCGSPLQMKTSWLNLNPGHFSLAAHIVKVWLDVTCTYIHLMLVNASEDLLFGFEDREKGSSNLVQKKDGNKWYGFWNLVRIAI